MPDIRKMFVVTNARGAIVGAGRFDPVRSDDGEVEVQVRPGEGQRVIEVPAEQIGPLSSEEDFKRLIAEYHVPRGRAELVRKREKKGAGPAGPAPSNKRPARPRSRTGRRRPR